MDLGKGTPGYRDRHILRQAAFAAVLIVLIAALVKVSGRFSGNTRMFIMVAGIVLAVPLANTAAPLLAMGKYRSLKKNELERAGAYSDRGELLYELVFTTREKIFPADLCLVKEGLVLVCLAGGNGKDAEALEGHLKRCLNLEKLRPKVRVYTDRDAFFASLEKLPPAAPLETEEVPRVVALLFRLSY